MEMHPGEALHILREIIKESDESSRALGRYLRTKGKNTQPMLDVGKLYLK